ncbi:MAG: hypothetical protein NVS3B11_27020 [Collimonas sp.]
MKLLLASLLLTCAALVQAAEVRFGQLYFFQSEQALQAKQIKPDEMARYSNKVQAWVWKALKKAQVETSSGYLVMAVRDDRKTAAWLDMDPAVSEYVEQEVIGAAKKIQAFSIAPGTGTVVFAIKMTLESPKWYDLNFNRVAPQQTIRNKPTPKAWDQAIKKIGNTDNIEDIVNAAWPKE